MITMSEEHPEFPQESPAIKYIVEQVAKVNSASSCAEGYYKSVAKIISRLDKTDVELNKLHMVVTDLKKITDSDVIASVIGKKSDEVNATLQDGISKTCFTLVGELDRNMNKIELKSKASVDQITAINERSIKINNDLEKSIAATSKRMDDFISAIRARVAPPLQTIMLYMVVVMLLSFGLGLVFGKYVV